MSNEEKIVVIQDPEFEVQQILSRKSTKSGVLYLIKWKNYTVDQATWEPVNNLFNSMNIVKEYQKNRHKAISNSDPNILNFDDLSQQPKTRKKAFNPHLIFPKSLKKQSQIQQLQRSPDKRKIIKKSKKGDKNKKIVGKGEQIKECQIQQNFWVLISHSEQSEQAVMEDVHPERAPASSQDNYSTSRVENQFSQHSINLSELEDEQNQRLTLENLNPDVFLPSKVSHEIRKKLIRVDNPSKQIKMLKADDPNLKNRELKIEKIAKINDKWLALVSLRKQNLGYIRAETLQMKNCKLMLDYLFDLLQR